METGLTSRSPQVPLPVIAGGSKDVDISGGCCSAFPCPASSHAVLTPACDNLAGGQTTGEDEAVAGVQGSSGQEGRTARAVWVGVREPWGTGELLLCQGQMAPGCGIPSSRGGEPRGVSVGV